MIFLLLKFFSNIDDSENKIEIATSDIDHIITYVKLTKI